MTQADAVATVATTRPFYVRLAAAAFLVEAAVLLVFGALAAAKGEVFSLVFIGIFLVPSVVIGALMWRYGTLGVDKRASCGRC